MQIIIDISDAVTAFRPATVGPKVIDPHGFMGALQKAIANVSHVPWIHGKAFVRLSEAIPFVTTGLANRKGLKVEDFVIREYAGEISMYAKREHALPPQSVGVMIWTGHAYRNDPQVTVEEAERTKDANFVIVGVFVGYGASVRRPGMVVVAD